MKDLLEVIVKGLVNNKDSVSITEKNTNDMLVFQVKVHPADMGQVIGKQGNMSKSIRNVMKAVAAKEHKKISVQFVD